MDYPLLPLIPFPRPGLTEFCPTTNFGRCEVSALLSFLHCVLKRERERERERERVALWDTEDAEIKVVCAVDPELCKVLSLKTGVGQNIALLCFTHCQEVCLSEFCLLIHSASSPPAQFLFKRKATYNDNLLFALMWPSPFNGLNMKDRFNKGGLTWRPTRALSTTASRLPGTRPTRDLATNNMGLSANEGHGNQQQGTVSQRGTWQPTTGDCQPARDMATNNRGLSANEGHGNQQQGTVSQRGTWQPTTGDCQPARDMATNSRGLLANKGPGDQQQGTVRDSANERRGDQQRLGIW